MSEFHDCNYMSISWTLDINYYSIIKAKLSPGMVFDWHNWGHFCHSLERAGLAHNPPDYWQRTHEEACYQKHSEHSYQHHRRAGVQGVVPTCCDKPEERMALSTGSVHPNRKKSIKMDFLCSVNHSSKIYAYFKVWEIYIK